MSRAFSPSWSTKVRPLPLARRRGIPSYGNGSSLPTKSQPCPIQNHIHHADFGTSRENVVTFGSFSSLHSRKNDKKCIFSSSYGKVGQETESDMSSNLKLWPLENSIGFRVRQPPSPQDCLRKVNRDISPSQLKSDSAAVRMILIGMERSGGWRKRVTAEKGFKSSAKGFRVAYGELF